MSIAWGNNAGKDDISSHFPLPMVQFEGEEFIVSDALTDYNVPKKDGKKKSDDSHVMGFFNYQTKRFKNQIRETVVFANAKVDYRDGVLAYVYSEEVSKSSKLPKGVICTEMTQWVIVDVRINEGDTSPVKARIWGFLQPRGFDGETPLTGKELSDRTIAKKQKDESDGLALSKEDFPRSGWTEYIVDFTGKSVERIRYEDGVQKKEVLPTSDYCLFVVRSGGASGPQIGYKIKLKMKLANEVTPEDKRRREKRIEEAKKSHPNLAKDADPSALLGPFSEVEAGCWLKVWARNENVQWNIDPSDDESNALAEKMERIDIGSGVCTEDGKAKSGSFSFNNHAFLRGRIAKGNDVKKLMVKSNTLVSLYVALVTSKGVKSLQQLTNLLKAERKNEDVAFYRKIASFGAATALEGALVMALTKWMESYSEKVRSRSSNPSDPEEKKKISKTINDRVEILTSVINFFQIPNILATFAIDGFENFNLEGFEKTAKSNPKVVGLLSTLYSMGIEAAFASVPEVYEKIIRSDIEDKKKALWDYLKMDGPEQQKTRWEKVKGLAKKQYEKSTLDTSNPNVLSFEYTIKEISDDKKFPQPWGEPLLTPALVPWAFVAFTLSYKAALFFALEFKLSETGLEFGAGIGFPKDTNVHFGVELCAPWSVMSKPAYTAAHHARMTEFGAIHRIADLESIDENEQLRGTTRDTPVRRAIKQLQSYIDIDVSMAIGLKGDGFIGFINRYNEKAKKRTTKLSGLSSKELGLEISFDMVFGLKFLLFSFAYPIFDIKLLSLTQEGLSVPLDGEICKLKKKFGEGIHYSFGQLVENELKFDRPETTVQQGPILSSAYNAPKARPMILYWGRPLKTMLLYKESEDSQAPKAKLKGYSAKGSDTPVDQGAWVNSRAFFSTDMAKDATRLKPPRLVGDFLLSVAGMEEALKGEEEQGSFVMELVKQNLKYPYVPINLEADCLRKKRPIEKNPGLFLFQPRHTKISSTVKIISGRKHVLSVVEMTHFFDKSIWVRMRKVGIFDSTIECAEKEWSLCSIDKAKEEFPRITGQFVVNIANYEVRSGTEIYLELSLIPGEEGIVNPEICKLNKIVI
ncbi:MAG: hypothetical protein IPK50_05760 [Fibrobacterota bacterium]|nr:MAG: hypothetical protein IPK50_05760 [Fibrobacterota bacterium]